MAQAIDGKALAARLRGEIAASVAALKAAHGVTPGLAVVLAGDDAASQVYVSSKEKAVAETGMNSFPHHLHASVTQEELCTLVRKLNADPAVHGILVQLPLPAGLDARAILDLIDPAKDVDGFHPVNAGRLASGLPGLVPCTPLGCLLLLRSVAPDLAGLHAVVLGRSNIVGKPVAQLLLQADCTVTIAHSRSRDLPALCRSADILVAAIGRPETVRGDWIKPGAFVIDVGINRIERDGKKRLVGDVAFAEAAHAAAVTPVPGGVGPMTIACLLRNTLQAACAQHKLPLPAMLAGMITCYIRQAGRIEPRAFDAAAPLPGDIAWIDLQNPDHAERDAVSKALGIDVPSRSETEEIEASSRLYVEDGAIYLTTAVLVGADTPDAELTDLTLIVTPRHFVILRFADPKSVAIFTARATRNLALVTEPRNAVLAFMDALADRTADMLELTGRKVDTLSRQIFEETAPAPGAPGARRRRLGDRAVLRRRVYAARFKDILYGIGRTGDVLHRSYRSINGMMRMSAFLAQALNDQLNDEQRTLMRTLQSDLRSLHDHAGFMIQESTFLLDATLGQINSEQNDTFRVLSLVSVLFLPLNLLAGIYGMNMSNVPGMSEPWGVWMVLGTMAVSVPAALIYFKRRGWW